jgi:hypothetical protein
MRCTLDYPRSSVERIMYICTNKKYKNIMFLYIIHQKLKPNRKEPILEPESWPNYRTFIFKENLNFKKLKPKLES